MDKKIHKKLNMIETVCVIMCVICMSVAAIVHPYQLALLKTLFLVIVSIAEILVISIELLLFYLETKKYKFITIAFYLIELLSLMLFNMNIPFSGLFVLTSFSILKNVFRVIKVEEIYPLLAYYELCKKYGIKVKKPRKPRASVAKKTAVPVKNKKKRSVKEEPTFA
ncbi:MAG: hypothetical protein IKF71_03335 [Bacilli bacterium]|nr:hypothetical protein [Bacilli bacterium]